jgi:hypothetical protein
MDGVCMTSAEQLLPPTGKGPTRPCLVTPLNGSIPHALLYDLTHDNQSYLDKRSAEDALSTGALVTFSYSAIGSVKGFDDLYPKHLNLVQEKRCYAITRLGEDSGIARAKRILNGLKTEMVLGGYEEGHMHQENDVSYHPLFLGVRICQLVQFLGVCSILSSIASSLVRRKGTCLLHIPRSQKDQKTEALVSIHFETVFGEAYFANLHSQPYPPPPNSCQVHYEQHARNHVLRCKK